MRLPKPCVLTSIRPASPRTARAGCSAPARGHTATVLSDQPVTQADAWRMIRRRGFTPRILKTIRIPAMRLACAVRSVTNPARSRCWRLASSSAGLGHLDDPADAGLTALQREQHSDQKLQVEAVGFRPPRTPFHRNTCRIDIIDLEPHHSASMRENPPHRIRMERRGADPPAGADTAEQRPRPALGDRLPGLEGPHRTSLRCLPRKPISVPSPIASVLLRESPRPPRRVLDPQPDQLAPQHPDEADQKEGAVAPAAASRRRIVVGAWVVARLTR